MVYWLIPSVLENLEKEKDKLKALNSQFKVSIGKQEKNVQCHGKKQNKTISYSQGVTSSEKPTSSQIQRVAKLQRNEKYLFWRSFNEFCKEIMNADPYQDPPQPVVISARPMPFSNSISFQGWVHMWSERRNDMHEKNFKFFSNLYPQKPGIYEWEWSLTIFD